jgi:hypothetical protein
MGLGPIFGARTVASSQSTGKGHHPLVVLGARGAASKTLLCRPERAAGPSIPPLPRLYIRMTLAYADRQSAKPSVGSLAAERQS